MTSDEVDAALRAGYTAPAAPETDEQAETRVANSLNDWLAKEGMTMVVNIVKVPVQVGQGQFVFADKPMVEIKKKKAEIIRPDASTSAAINRAISQQALASASGMKLVK